MTSTDKFYGSMMGIFGLEADAILVIITIYGRFAWLTPDRIIFPAALNPTLSADDAEWTLKNNILIIYEKRSRKRSKYRIIGDIHETAHMLEENYIKHI